MIAPKHHCEGKSISSMGKTSKEDLPLKSKSNAAAEACTASSMWTVELRTRADLVEASMQITLLSRPCEPKRSREGSIEPWSLLPAHPPPGPGKNRCRPEGMISTSIFCSLTSLFHMSCGSSPKTTTQSGRKNGTIDERCVAKITLVKPERRTNFPTAAAVLCALRSSMVATKSSMVAPLRRLRPRQARACWPLEQHPYGRNHTGTSLRPTHGKMSTAPPGTLANPG
mmetsp:Transcript_102302/g.264930  ORF Transcript_102302/g.264930 Transcript_102302/m.264930 type:complete len:227 (-) Transcript_102302:640-1320(-)